MLTLPRQFFGNLPAFGGMGRMDGMGGARSRGTSFFEDDDDMGPFTSTGGMPGGMPGMGRSSTGRRSPRHSTQTAQQNEVSKPLPISLEDLYQGVTKRMKVSRKMLSGETEEKVS